MIEGKTVLALIPARGGSKRVPNKNLREFRGKPLVSWAIEQAKASKYIDTIMVSSDYQEILNLCPEEMRIERPAELATDTASSEDAMRHALSLQPHDWIVLLQPTSPLRIAEDIDACIERAQMSFGCVSFSDGDWQQNGAVYVVCREWIEKHDFTHAGLMKYVMPAERSLDINYESDFQ